MSFDPDAVLFDLDGTLCTYERPGEEVLAAAFDRVGVEPAFEMAAFHDRYVEFLAESPDGRTLFARTFAALLADRGLDPADGPALADAFLAKRGPEELRPIDGARETVEALATNYRLGLVTNGHPSLQRPKLDRLGLAGSFETVVFAGYETAAKPDPEPFERALSPLEVPADRAVYVGNVPSIDVAGARAAGLRAAWLADGRRAEPEPDYTLEALAELTEPPWASVG